MISGINKKWEKLFFIYNHTVTECWMRRFIKLLILLRVYRMISYNSIYYHKVNSFNSSTIFIKVHPFYSPIYNRWQTDDSSFDKTNTVFILFKWNYIFFFFWQFKKKKFKDPAYRLWDVIVCMQDCMAGNCTFIKKCS